MPALAASRFYGDGIVDKLAADTKFIEFINLINNTEEKIRNLSIEDKKLFKRYTQQNNVAEIAKLYKKNGIDYKETSLQKMTIINELNKKYELNKRNDKKEILNSALLKVKTPFAECLLGLLIGATICDMTASGNDYLYCIMSVEAAYLVCIFALD